MAPRRWYLIPRSSIIVYDFSYLLPTPLFSFDSEAQQPWAVELSRNSIFAEETSSKEAPRGYAGNGGGGGGGGGGD
ncbi:uncharacterized protein CTRU02_203090 [Colletotrichum truncatum]|uniref:Uncharacterized protein n=1 Tax=Colletotrichum truncatum TaxID=5467 RepID=A0ACC3Z8B0_COLTU